MTEKCVFTPRLQEAAETLHELVGICGHCGKKKCPGKQSHSTLPAEIPTTDVMEAARRAGLNV